MANVYSYMALPGSPVFHEAQENNCKLLGSYVKYTFFDSQPLPTKYLSSREVIIFQDEGWQEYFNNLKTPRCSLK
jgi:anaerobic magnesium-protoporphyrin IX monomethyl ester cyclase